MEQVDKVIFLETKLKDARLIKLEPSRDERGYFARTWCRNELTAAGLSSTLAQESVSYNHSRGTVRGMHLQEPPHEEIKIVRCLRGAIFDAIVDLRPTSRTYLEWQSFELSATNGEALYIPAGFAHGFQTLADDTEVYYQISEFYVPGAAAGYRFDDPAFKITWPLPTAVISERDLAWPAFDSVVHARMAQNSKPV